jgi:hypothetical protein
VLHHRHTGNVDNCKEGPDLAREGNEIIREAGKWSPELAAACEVWKEKLLMMVVFTDFRNNSFFHSKINCILYVSDLFTYF